MRFIFLTFVILISGCATGGHIDSHFKESIYVRKNMCPQRIMPEYYNYGEVVDKSTYRRMPSYIQDCYERIEQ